jgi:OmpA-OmpF porin, OOP family
MKDKKMNKKLISSSVSSCVAVSLLCVAGAAFAEGGDSGFNIGISGGGTRANLSEDDLNRALRSQNYVSPTSSVKNTDNTYRISGGYRFSPIFSLEAHYTDLGKYSSESRATLVPNAGAGTVSAKYKTSGFGVDALVSAPLGTGFSIYGRVGVMRAKTEANFTSSGSIFVSPTSRLDASANTTAYSYGIGAQYDINKQIAIRAEGQRYDKLGNDNTGGKLKLDVYTIGAVFSF